MDGVSPRIAKAQYGTQSPEGYPGFWRYLEGTEEKGSSLSMNV